MRKNAPIYTYQLSVKEVFDILERPVPESCRSIMAHLSRQILD